MSVTSGETLNCLKVFLRVGTPSALASAIVDVAPVLDVKAIVCLGKVSRVGCRVVEEQSETKTVLAIGVLPGFPWHDPVRSSAGNLE